MNGARASASERLGAAGAAAACLALLSMGAWLAPDASGHGTHTQLGLPACGWAEVLGRPCPTCGMTTALASAANGELTGAFATQPMGALVAVAAAVLFWLALHSAATGSRLWALVMAAALRPAVVAGLFVGLAAAWGYKLLVWQG